MGDDDELQQEKSIEDHEESDVDGFIDLGDGDYGGEDGADGSVEEADGAKANDADSARSTTHSDDSDEDSDNDADDNGEAEESEDSGNNDSVSSDEVSYLTASGVGTSYSINAQVPSASQPGQVGGNYGTQFS